VSDIMFRAPDRRRADAHRRFLSEPGATGPDMTWDLGEPAYWFRTERRTPDWVVVRYVRGEQPHDKFGEVPPSGISRETQSNSAGWA